MRRDKVIRLIGTLCYVGYSPLAPGTLASLIGLFLYLLVKGIPNLYYAITFFTLILGFYATRNAAVIFGKTDPREIVIDELAGILIAYLFLPININVAILGFLLFRLIDIIKFPIIKRIEAMPGAYGIMLDDIAAGILTNILLRAVLLLKAIPLLQNII